MKNIFDIHYYNDNFLEKFIADYIVYFDLWNIQILENRKNLIYGTSKETDKFQDFILEYSSLENPVPLIIILADAENNYPMKMNTFKMKYFKLSFDNYEGNSLGTPLILNYRK